MRQRSSTLLGRIADRAAIALVLNSIPVVLALSVAWLYWSGEVEFRPGTESLLPVLVGLGLAMVTLVFLAGFIGPVQLGVIRQLSRRDPRSPAEGLRRVTAAFFGPLLWLGALATLFLVLVNMAAIALLFWRFAVMVMRIRG